MLDFKTFVGPIATIFASLVAVGVTGYFAWHQRNIADQQKEIAKNKLKLDLFDRRYKAFESIFPYYNALVDWRGTDEQKEARTHFFMSYHQSRFLFGGSVESIFKELVDAGNKVIGFRETKDLIKGDPELFNKAFNETQNILLNVFDTRLSGLKEAVQPYIDLTKIQ